MIKLFDNTFNAIEQKLNLHLERHAVLSGNVANSDTPNFLARDLPFKAELAKALNIESDKGGILKTNPRHMSMNDSLTGPKGAVALLDNSGAVGADGNNVDLDIQMGKMRGNSRAYSGAANLLTMKLRLLRAAASGRGGV